MAEVNNTHVVKKGDCAWNVAKANLKEQGKKVSNAEIMKEIQRLATLNGCNDANDLSAKFFNTVGKELKLQENQQTPPKRAKLINRQDSTPIAEPDAIRVARPDSTKVVNKPDTTRVAPPDSTRVAPPDSTNKANQVTPVQTEMQKINSMKNDTQKIIEYNKNHATGNYVIIDKKTCKATVYNKAGQVLQSYEVLLGSDVGDDMNTSTAADPSKRRQQTVPGEFTLGPRQNKFGGCYSLGNTNETMDPDIEYRKDAPGSGGKKAYGGMFQAIHGTATRNRDALYNDGNLANNRVSMGCVNIPLDDLAEMEQKYGIGQGSKLYILPEDRGNYLKLETQADGTTKFVTQYADESQNQKRAKVQNQIAQGNIQRQLRAKQKAEQEARQRELLAQQQKKENFRWYNPSTWYWS